MIDGAQVVGDIIHVTDLYTTFARLGGATDKIPTDRIIDGIDQTALMLKGDTHGRRDYVFIYSINKLEAVVKEQYKLAIPGGNMENAIIADFFDLFRDPQEKYPVATEIGAWGYECAAQPGGLHVNEAMFLVEIEDLETGGIIRSLDGGVRWSSPPWTVWPSHV